jgi:heme/copper-type cytochrome/quinol oxidase subunit 4
MKSGGTTDYAGSLGKILIIYLCILLLAGLQFVIAYQHWAVRTMFLRMLLIAIVEAGLAVTFFMHLGSEDRKFTFSVAVVVIFVLISMQFSWTDSFRLLHGVPGANSSAGPK